MKKLNTYLFNILAITGVVFLYSCGEDEPEPTEAPVVSLSGGDFDDVDMTATGQPGDQVMASFNVSAEGGINVITVSKSGGVADSNFPMDVFVKTSGEDGPVTQSGSFTYTLVEEEVGVTVTFTVTAVEDTDTPRQGTLSLTLETTSPDAEIQTAKLLFAPTADETSKTFYSISEGETFSVNDVEATAGASANIDIGYFFVTEANLASPSDYSTAFTGAYDLSDWDVRRETQMVLTTLTDLIEVITVADVEAITDDIDFDADGASTIEGLAVDDVYAFETADGLVGLMQVLSIQPGFDQGDNIELEFVLAR